MLCKARTLYQRNFKKEIDAGRIVGHFRTHPFPVFRTSPIGLVPKKTPNEFRLIHHLSYPKGLSVNDSIPEDCSSVHYPTISDAVDTLKNLGAGCYMAETDIKSAFRKIPVHALDYPLLGIKWEDHYYFDRCLAMGLKSSAKLLTVSRLPWSGLQNALYECLLFYIF